MDMTKYCFLKNPENGLAPLRGHVVFVAEIILSIGVYIMFFGYGKGFKMKEWLS